MDILFIFGIPKMFSIAVPEVRMIFNPKGKNARTQYT